MSAGRKSTSNCKDWGTPKKYVDLVNTFFDGQIDFDPCSNEHSIVNADTECILPCDGLRIEWNYSKIYVNPPYGRDTVRGTTIKNWFFKVVDAHKKYGSEILMLVPVATNTSHWKDYVFGVGCSVCFLYDTRLKFLENGMEGGKGAPMACAMIYYGKQKEKFKKIFSFVGFVVYL